jgi:hypothetical protein
MGDVTGLFYQTERGKQVHVGLYIVKVGDVGVEVLVALLTDVYVDLGS